MQQFFTLQLRTFCVFILFAGMVLLHFSRLNPSNEFEIFSKWVHTQVENNFNDISLENDQRFDSNQNFIKQLKKILHDRSDQSAPIDSDTMRYLYLTWTTFSANSDMAGTVSFDRAKPLSYVNQGQTVSGFSPFSLSKLNYKNENVASGINSNNDFIFAYLTLPTVSGISINAP